MFRHSSFKLGLICLQAIALFTVAFSRSANSQDLGFTIDYNQSRQFFEEGSEKMEEEIDRIKASNYKNFPIIELPAKFSQNNTKKRELKNLSFIDEYRYGKYEDLGLRSN